MQLDTMRRIEEISRFRVNSPFDRVLDMGPSWGSAPSDSYRMMFMFNRVVPTEFVAVMYYLWNSP